METLSFDSCIAISPDGKKIVTFSPVKKIKTLEFKLDDINNLSSSESISAPISEVNNELLCWSIAISNCVDDIGNERFIALSCFDTRLETNDINKKDEEHGGRYFSQTWVISTKNSNEICNSPIGGVIRFLDVCSAKNRIVIIIVNKSGIYKETMSNNIKKRFFSQPSKIEQFELPQQLLICLRPRPRPRPRLRPRPRPSQDKSQNSLKLLYTSIINNYFMVHSFENRKQIIEMYSLITGNLKMLFKRHESSVAPDIIRGSPIFAISQKEKILAFCRGNSSITLYFMENGLEIVTKQLEGQRGIHKIVDINFIDDDSKLLIILEEKEEKEDQVENFKIHQIFVVWDLFTTFENSIRQIETSNPLKIDVTHRLLNSRGKMFAIRDNGDIFSVFDHKDVASIRNSTTPSEKKMTEIRDRVDHAIYNVDGKSSDTSKLIINNVEPWHPNKSYFRISVYLDSTESTQLIISSNTIQVWKYNNTIEELDKRDRVLEYIWARNKEIEILELKVREREFLLEISAKDSTRTIHWPNNVNVLEGACRALYVLSEKKIEAGQENGNQIKYLVECTQRLVRKYITEYGIFRLTSIRYPIMKYLIIGCQESLIKHILNKKINRKNSNIYIPRLYEKTIHFSDQDNNGSTKPDPIESDLQYAILCIQERGNSTTILKYLIDYYADNAKEYNNYGWMFTVSKAIPLLYDNNLREFVQYLFKKPCFGITEAYTPPLHIKPYDQRKGNNAAVIYPLAVKPRLALKSNNTSRLSLKNLFTRFQTSRNDRKVYIVPLPDFTVYPIQKNRDSKDLGNNIGNYSKYFWFLFTFFRLSFWLRQKDIDGIKSMSPFHRVIYEEKGYEIYQTPTIMAVLSFKWSAARRYFIHHIIMYILYAISYTLAFESNEIIVSICFIVFPCTGFYLIVTEIVQLKNEGWHRYMNVYNVFELGSVLLPLANFIYLFCFKEIILPDSVFLPIYAFTDLVMWLEVLFLLRYFEVPGRFVYIIISILNNVLPFFAFMLSAVLAFGHAMFILLKVIDDSSLHYTTYKIEDTSNSSSSLYSNITIKQDIDRSYRHDNLYSSFFSSVESVFFWTNGRWDQLDQWDNYAIDVISILGSIILVLIFQNMLIAFMNGAFDQANKESHTAAHRYRTKFIEALEKPDSEKDNPRYIYYIPDPAMIDTWLKETKKEEEQKLRLMGENLAELTESTDFDDYCDDDYNCDDNDNGDGDDNQDNSKNEGSSSTMEPKSIEPNTTNCDKFLFIDEEIFTLKFASSKLSKKSKRFNNEYFK
ncbi:hypothetical protein Glove_168g146 [Diversispora epigaea]|uniref:Ion transport domain-containing protein n=1 Tax=Diversispora epigaea TaxID=1348612 RepID=A0A397IUI4_9GLOM|nr:hypothetical protein Glove_168g146 [Diversispora epigaea]